MALLAERGGRSAGKVRRDDCDDCGDDCGDGGDDAKLLCDEGGWRMEGRWARSRCMELFLVFCLIRAVEAGVSKEKDACPKKKKEGVQRGPHHLRATCTPAFVAKPVETHERTLLLLRVDHELKSDGGFNRGDETMSDLIEHDDKCGGSS